jgi:hypothetical protein
MLIVGVNTMGLWARYGLIGNAILLLGATYGLVLLLGRIPVGSRSPLSVVAGSVHAVLSPRTGRLAGRPVRPRRPHVVRHRITVLLDVPAPPATGRLPKALLAAPAPAPAPAPVPEPTPEPAPQPVAAQPPGPRRQVALSGVQALLAQVGTQPPAQED